jgi:uncharacterized protein YbbK (DUF523 family)
MMEQARAKIGVSSCLLGNAVRYDGSHKYCQHIADALGEQFALTAFCPEMAIGLGVPRPPIQLVFVKGEIRVRGVANPEQDVTRDIQAYAQSISPELEALSGYIFKARSPSCGVADVPAYRPDGSAAAETASGLFAQAIQNLLPDLPLTNEEALLDGNARSDFISRVLGYQQSR